MLPKKYRLSLKTIRFQSQAFKRFESSFYRLYLLKNEGYRATVIISKHQIQKNSMRNLIKRRVSSMLLKILREKDQNKDHDIGIVVWIKNGCQRATASEVFNSLQNHLLN